MCQCCYRRMCDYSLRVPQSQQLNKTRNRTSRACDDQTPARGQRAGQPADKRGLVRCLLVQQCFVEIPSPTVQMLACDVMFAGLVDLSHIGLKLLVDRCSSSLKHFVLQSSRISENVSGCMLLVYCFGRSGSASALPDAYGAPAMRRASPCCFRYVVCSIYSKCFASARAWR